MAQHALIQRRNKAFRNERGMSLIELMIAMVVLMVGLVGSMALVAVSVGNNGRSRQQGNSTIVSQLITEKISSVKATTSPTLAITDCAGNAFNISTTAPGGSPLLASGDVDFAQARSLIIKCCTPTAARPEDSSLTTCAGTFSSRLRTSSSSPFRLKSKMCAPTLSTFLAGDHSDSDRTGDLRL